MVLFFIYLTDFSYFPLKSQNVAVYSQNISKLISFKGGCRRFQLFFVDFQLFYFLTRIIPIIIIYILGYLGNTTTR